MVERWARSHPWAAAYVVAFVPIVLMMIVARIAGWADGAVVLVSLCSVAIAGFVLDALKRRPEPPQQRAQAE